MFKKILKKWDYFKENHFSGHWYIGKSITVYGENAMQWSVNIKTKRFGYICFRLPFRCFGGFPPLYLYLSPNGTPWASTYSVGGRDTSETVRAKSRFEKFGHNFDVDANYEQLRKINDQL